MFEHEFLQELLNVIDPLLTDADRFKQRGAADILAGLLRGMQGLFVSRASSYPLL